MAAKKTETKEATEQHACPNCGYCPHCGRSDRPAPMIPAPYRVPVPARPYRPYPPYWYGEGKVWCGGSTAVPRFDGQTFSVSASATYC